MAQLSLIRVSRKSRIAASALDQKAPYLLKGHAKTSKAPLVNTDDIERREAKEILEIYGFSAATGWILSSGINSVG
jgi:hypothetical protein